ncbi:MAG: hypothetical protein ABIA93_02050 [Candidatus Woesearchaeota archaeon]
MKAIIIALLVLLVACTAPATIQPLPNGTLVLPANGTNTTGVNITPSNGSSGPVNTTYYPEYDDGLDSCVSNDDCLIVRAGYCGGARAINSERVDEWNAQLAEEDKNMKGTQCGVSLPLDYFTAACYEGTCRAEQNRPLQATDDFCEMDTECVVKNVGNCCGYYPKCVNVDYQPDTEAVQKQCAEQGIASVCGWQEIESCSCQKSRCEEVYNNIQ